MLRQAGADDVLPESADGLMPGDASNFLTSGKMLESEFSNSAGDLAIRSPEPQVGVRATSLPRRCISTMN
jgi:hypothetical protein